MKTIECNRSAAFSRNGAVEDEVRPHPQERENHLSGLERIAVGERLKDIQKISLSLGERAGVRASFCSELHGYAFRRQTRRSAEPAGNSQTIPTPTILQPKGCALMSFATK